MVLVHCIIAPHKDIFTIEVQVDTSFTRSFCVMLQTKFKLENYQRVITLKLCKRENPTNWPHTAELLADFEN